MSLLHKTIKAGARIIAITSSPIERKTSISIKSKFKNKIKIKNPETLIVGVIGRKNNIKEINIEGILSIFIECDADNATIQIIKMIKRSRFYKQIKLIAINGIAIAGLNIINIYEIKKQLDIDVIVITRDKPRSSKLINALRKFKKENKINIQQRIDIINKYKSISIYHEKFYIKTILEFKDIKNIIDLCNELLRLSHLIAAGVKTGESKGRI